MSEQEPVYGPPPVPAGQNGLATASLVCGILSFVCCGFFTGVPAIIMGHMVLGQIKRGETSESARGFAIAGLVLGYINLVLTVIAIIGYAIMIAFMFMSSEFRNM